MFNNAQDRCSITSLGLFVLESLSNNDLDGHENALLQTLSRLLHLVHFVKCWQFFLELNSKRLSQCLGKEIESRCPVFTSLKKREIGSFTSQSCSDGKLKKGTKKRDARAQLLFCQSKPVAFVTFLLTSPWSLLKLPNEASIDRNNCSRVRKLLHFY